MHRRPGPGGHSFTQPVVMAFLDLSEIADVCRLHPLWSAHWPAPIWWRRKDFLGDPAVPLDQAVRDLVEDRTGSRPTGPIVVLTHPRAWGWMFNPITCYYCLAEPGEPVIAMVAEVTNTPWHERHCYVMGGAGTHNLEKALHVSPFLGMDLSYTVRFTEPGETLSVSIEVCDKGDSLLFAGMTLWRRPADRSSLARLLWSPRRGTMGVSAGVYRQAAALGAKGARFHPHPKRATGDHLPSRPGQRR